MAGIRSKLELRDGFVFLRRDMSFIKSFWYLWLYCREIFVMNERAKARKLRHRSPAQYWRLLANVRKYKAKDFNRAQVFSFYLRVMTNAIKASIDE